jgi:hypothetical protein
LQDIPVIYLAPFSQTESSSLPVTKIGVVFCATEATPRNLFGLATRKVYLAFCIAAKSVVSYTAFSPLPQLLEAVCFCGTGCKSNIILDSLPVR